MSGAWSVAAVPRPLTQWWFGAVEIHPRRGDRLASRERDSSFKVSVRRGGGEAYKGIFWGTMGDDDAMA